MNQVVVAGMRLPDVTAGAELPCDIEDRVGDFRDDIISQESWAVVDVEFVRPAGAEIPCLAGLGSEWAPGRKEGTYLGNDIGRFIELKQRRTWPAPGGTQSYKDPHVRAALVRIRVSPIGVADVIDAVCSAAVGGVRNANAFGFVGGRKGEGAPCRRDEGLDLGGRVPSARIRALFFDPAAGKGTGCLSHDGGSDEHEERTTYGSTKDYGTFSDQHHGAFLLVGGPPEGRYHRQTNPQ